MTHHICFFLQRNLLNDSLANVLKSQQDAFQQFSFMFAAASSSKSAAPSQVGAGLATRPDDDKVVNVLKSELVQIQLEKEELLKEMCQQKYGE